MVYGKPLLSRNWDSNPDDASAPDGVTYPISPLLVKLHSSYLLEYMYNLPIVAVTGLEPAT